MSWYRIYTVGRDGYYIGARDIECTSDNDAIHEAQQNLGSNDIEVWTFGRFLARLPANLRAAIWLEGKSSQNLR